MKTSVNHRRWTIAACYLCLLLVIFETNRMTAHAAAAGSQVSSSSRTQHLYLRREPEQGEVLLGSRRMQAGENDADGQEPAAEQTQPPVIPATSEQAQPPVIPATSEQAQPPVIQATAEQAQPPVIQATAEQAQPPVIQATAEQAQPPVKVEEATNVNVEVAGGDNTAAEASSENEKEVPAPDETTGTTEAEPETKTVVPTAFPTVSPVAASTEKPTVKPYTATPEDPVKAEDLEHAAAEELQELETQWKKEEKVAREAGGFGIFFGIIAMIFTAHQMSENPDGIYASICRLAITISSVIVKIVCMPCRKLMGAGGNGNPYSGHMPISTTDYSYRNDPYRSNANAGFEMS